MAPLEPMRAPGVSVTLPAGDTPVLVPPFAFKELTMKGSDLLRLHWLSGMFRRLPAPPVPLPEAPVVAAGTLEFENLSEP